MLSLKIKIAFGLSKRTNRNIVVITKGENVKKVRVKSREELERLGFIYEGQIKGRTEIMNKKGDIVYSEVIGKVIEVKQAPKDTGYDYQCRKYYFDRRWLHLHLDKDDKKDSKKC